MEFGICFHYGFRGVKFEAAELFRCDMGRNRVCSSSIPSESFDIIDLRATARTVGEWVLGFVSITGFVECDFGAALFHSARIFVSQCVQRK